MLIMKDEEQEFVLLPCLRPS